jgi:hypothetical protein
MPAAMALIAAALARFQLLFDIRGLLAEEYVDAGIWRRGSLPYRLITRVERIALGRAMGAVVLTHRVRDALLAEDDGRVQVIPCCADLEHVHSQQHCASRPARGSASRIAGCSSTSATSPAGTCSAKWCSSSRAPAPSCPTCTSSS